MQIPSVHIGGTSRDQLLEDLCEAMHAGRMFLEKLAVAAPNARDFYPQGPAAIYQAQNEYRARVLAVQRVIDELNTLAEAIA